MGSSIWEYLWLLAHVTAPEPSEDETSVGIVDHGNPVPTFRIAADLKRSREATLANLERLEAGNYIKRSAAAGHAYDYRVKILLEGQDCLHGPAYTPPVEIDPSHLRLAYLRGRRQLFQSGIAEKTLVDATQDIHKSLQNALQPPHDLRKFF